MSAPPRGLYELLLTEALSAEIAQLPAALTPRTDALRLAEAPDRIALHLSRIIERAIASIEDTRRVELGVALARQLVAEIDRAVSKLSFASDAPATPGAVLRAVAAMLPDGTPEEIQEPLIPLLDTALLTNAPGEPRVGSQLLAEVHSADRIDVVMAFVRMSGIRPLLEALRVHRGHGRILRVLTTTYTGSTDPKALDALQELGADVRVSYDVSSTRLHAKAWLFHRGSEFSTAYIGSSNLTHSAQVSGLEWNVRVSASRNRAVIEKVGAVFESYWNSTDFVPYEREVFLAQMERGRGGSTLKLSPIEVRAEPFQEDLLEQIAVSRALGHHRNLLVSATGTGKTVMAALDYARLRQHLPRARLLFVAHRKEILDQSLATFRHVLRDHAFGELWVDGDRPSQFEHVFASIQSLHARGLEALQPSHFDIVVIDEFHHAAASSYSRLLEHVAPVELLGLTATPERCDDLPLLHWFGDRIAAELRLWDAIDQHRLTPFVYYGISDGLDLRDIPWRRGRGYDVEGLTNLFTGNDVWAKLVLAKLADHIDELSRMRALGFCVSVEHARFMARVFSEAGINAVAIWADTPGEERRAALANLAAGRTQVLFSVDLFNEGVDVPAADTLLFLRPTDSPTLFLQQLGRGLRRHLGKTTCTVLDFVGHHRKEFRFDRRYRALLGGTIRNLREQIEAGFPFLPAGCHMQLDPVARELVLANIRAATPTRWSAKVDELRRWAATGANVSLAGYLEETGIELEDLYAGDKTWSDLCEDAAVLPRIQGPHESVLRRAIGRFLHVDDTERCQTYAKLLQHEQCPQVAAFDERQRRLLRMLIAPLVDKAVDKTTQLQEACELVWQHERVRCELAELFGVLAGKVAHLHHSLPSHPDVPLQVHARYTRLEVLAAFGIGTAAKVPPWQTGVYWVDAAKTDLLAFTLDKTDAHFSPTTRYRDYAINSELVHWESQSVTRADGETGRRYRSHEVTGSHVMLFARLRSDERAFWFLGPATFVKSEGELPMAITWRLRWGLPGGLFVKFAAAVA